MSLVVLVIAVAACVFCWVTDRQLDKRIEALEKAAGIRK